MMMMMTNTGHIMTLANSIIGVGILAMPFCFQKCGVILSVLLLIVNNLITRISCHYLIKSSVITRRKSFEFLAFHTFGSSGKLMVELCIIGYLLGTCIAYFVVVGDLGPQIIGKIFNLNETTIKLRSLIMITVTFLCIIPLGLLRNVDSLSTVCTASIGFYFCLVFKVIGESTTHLLNNNYWLRNIEYWKPSGILQCLPIFSMALACQIQLFEVLNTLPNPSIEKMNRVVNVATMICTYVYILVGFFGYIAFSNQTFSGNILVHLSPSLASDAIKMGFVLSVAFSFPLVIFPCRASIYSLLYRKGHIDTTGYIPEFRFKVITTSIILFSLFIGILIPSIELVIGLVGSTIGIAICIMFPALCFMKISKKESSEKSLAQFILIGGFCLMILGTYANLNAIDEKHSGLVTIDDEHNKIIQNTNNLINNNNNKNKDNNNNNNNNNNDFGIKSFKNHSDNLMNVKDKTQLVLNNNNNKQIENNKTIIMKQKNQEEKQLINKYENNDNKNQNYKENIQTVTEKYIEKSSNNFLNNLKNVNLNNNNNNNNLNDDNENEKTKNINEKLNKNQQILNFINNNNNNNNNRNNENENNQINMNNIEIDKDAIKKDEEITAEEELKNKNKNIIIVNDNSDTANELVKTKKLLEKKVDELKEQLAKHNVETQNLVAEKLGDIVQKVKQIEKQVYKDNNNNNNNNDNDNDNIIKNNNNTNTNKLNIETINTINEKNNNEKISSVIENDKIVLKNNNKLNNNEIENKIQIKKNISKNDDKKLNIKENQMNQQPLPLPLLINATVIKQHQQQEHQKSQNLINNNDDNNNNNNNQYQSLPPNINDNNLKNLNVKISNNKLEDNNNNNNNNEQNNNNVNNIDSIRRDILGVVTNKDIIVITSTPSLPLSNSNIINEKNKNIDNNDNNLREKRELTKGSCINWDLNNIDCLDINNNNNNNINDDNNINENINHNNNNNNNNKNNNFHINDNDNDNNKKSMLQSIGRDLKSIKEKT